MEHTVRFDQATEERLAQAAKATGCSVDVIIQRVVVDAFEPADSPETEEEFLRSLNDAHAAAERGEGITLEEFGRKMSAKHGFPLPS